MQYQLIEIDGKKFISTERRDKHLVADSLAIGLNVYYLRHGDGGYIDGAMIEENEPFVNFWGILIGRQALPVGHSLLPFEFGPEELASCDNEEEYEERIESNRLYNELIKSGEGLEWSISPKSMSFIELAKIVG